MSRDRETRVKRKISRDRLRKRRMNDKRWGENDKEEE